MPAVISLIIFTAPAPYEEIRRDFEQVTAEIRRFAGDRIWREPVNGLHFAETTRAGARALRDCGIRCLLGYYIFDRKGNPAGLLLFGPGTDGACRRPGFLGRQQRRDYFLQRQAVLDAWPLAEIPRNWTHFLRSLPERLIL